MHFSFNKTHLFSNNCRVTESCKNSREGSHVLCIQFPQMVTSYITIIEYQVRTSTLLLCTCIGLCHFITCVDMFYNMCTHLPSQDTELCSPHKNHPCAIPVYHLHLPPSPISAFLTHQWVKEIEREIHQTPVLEGPTDRAAVMHTIRCNIMCSFCDRDKL